ncbi:TadE family protein [Boseongicola aestuarii]|uniref:TadE-like protein n=1 Tax=Boseongicola aestuarii TaxID=1470561 RepID=A0A238IUI2_9RHOB|nr:TadE family protein [Boseongicola aestuarii]SMX22048.1 TadE-like protein [Boseongicola aestuarii]
MVEFAICISLFLLILFAIIDFGRLGYNWVVAEKGMQRAVRIAAVRPPICPDVPLFHRRANPNESFYPAGTLCRSVGGLCEVVNRQCTLNAPDGSRPEAATAANEIWAAVENLLPQGSTRANVLIRYEYDQRLGFLGGPYVPLITAELVGPSDGSDGFNDLLFTFVTPLSALAANAGDNDVSDIPGTIPFPGISVSLPAEDMNLGSRG